MWNEYVHLRSIVPFFDMHVCIQCQIYFYEPYNNQIERYSVYDCLVLTLSELRRADAIYCQSLVLVVDKE